MTERITAVVAEDSHLVRAGVISMLEASGINVLASVADLQSLRDAVAREQPDVVITDIRMPPTGTDEGITLARELAASNPEIGVVLLSQHASATYATEVFSVGNPRRAYLMKERIANAAVLLEAIESVTQGRPQLDPEVLSVMLAARHGVDALTPREREVLALMAEGLSNTAIAERLVITTRAVERHINSLFSKLELDDAQATNRRVLAVLAYLRDVD